MRNMVRVLVTEEWTDEAGDFQSMTLFEAASRDPQQLSRFVPAEVAAVLGATTAAVAVGWEGDDTSATEPVTTEAAPATEEKPRRKRRTKAEMLEAERAKGAGPTGNGDADLAAGAALATGAAPADPTAAYAQNGAPEAGAMSEALAEQEPPAPVPVYNPFM